MTAPQPSNTNRLMVEFKAVIERNSMTVEEACEYLQTSRATLDRRAKQYGYEVNIFGRWNKETLDEMRLLKRRKA